MSRAADIHKIFATELATFAAAYPALTAVRLEFRRRHFLAKPAPRDLAWYDPNTRTVCIVRRALATRTAGTLRGIIRHELGHAVDHVQGTIDAPRAERRADIHALHATGQPVCYTSDGVQHASRGATVRPRWLHQ